jgi:hypothetical protein
MECTERPALSCGPHLQTSGIAEKPIVWAVSSEALFGTDFGIDVRLTLASRLAEQEKRACAFDPGCATGFPYTLQEA